MRCEIPILLRCCFCFPLRYGLLVWAYLKQISSISFSTVMIIKLCHDYYRIQASGAVISSLIILLMILDIAFNVLFIISAHKKDYKKMRIFYRYSIAVLCLNVAIVGFCIAMYAYYVYVAPIMIIFIWSFMVPTLVMIIVMVFLQGYLIILVRSEFIKLKNNSQFEFVNHGADEKCTANLDFVKEIPGTV
ncbi:uncharacterized protein LOC123873345 [Maniola jurtina]|uniref:uncharacterized protein LOC123873345 n=1 Tax=Maniola jurtina TaxID=191418 RepID=UPI001E68B2F2|nr:uncharacterized protein LOC123873345 [Maniola jurtina]